MDQNLYIGGKKSFGGFQAPKSNLNIGGFQAPEPNLNIGGFQAPESNLIVGGIKKRKRQKKFKKTKNTTEILNNIKNIIENVSQKLGLNEKSPKQIDTQIYKERLKFKSITNKRATQIKKMSINGGLTTKQANEYKKKYLDAVKEGLKRISKQYLLSSLRDFNNGLI